MPNHSAIVADDPVNQPALNDFLPFGSGSQLYRYVFTHSPWLLVLTALDLVVILLTWHEYRLLRRMRST
jgi:uncharacterized membrane protein